MKKGLLLSACLLIISACGVFGYETYNVNGETYSYVMNVYDAGEGLGFEGNNGEQRGDFQIYSDTLLTGRSNP